jgi:uncharacterized protein
MKLRVIPLLAALLLPVPAFSQAVPEAFAADINQLLTLTNGKASGVQMANTMIQQMVAAMSRANPNLPPEAPKIVTEVVSKFVTGLIDGKEMNDLMVAAYAKHFTQAEVKALIEFYKSPLGSKVASTMPQLAGETAQASQQLFQQHAPELQTELQQRFAAAGIQ